MGNGEWGMGRERIKNAMGVREGWGPAVPGRGGERECMCAAVRGERRERGGVENMEHVMSPAVLFSIAVSTLARLSPSLSLSLLSIRAGVGAAGTPVGAQKGGARASAGLPPHKQEGKGGPTSALSTFLTRPASGGGTVGAPPFHSRPGVGRRGGRNHLLSSLTPALAAPARPPTGTATPASPGARPSARPGRPRRPSGRRRGRR